MLIWVINKPTISFLKEANNVLDIGLVLAMHKIKVTQKINKVDLKLLSEDVSYLKALENAYIKQTKKEFADITVYDKTNITFTYKGKTYKDTIESLTYHMVRYGGFNSRSDALNSLKSGLGHKVTYPIDLQLLNNPDYCKALETAYLKDSNKVFVDATVDDETTTTFAYNGKIYQGRIDVLTGRMYKSGSFKSQKEALNFLKSSSGHTVTFPIDLKLLHSQDFLKTLEFAYTKKTKKEFAKVTVMDQNHITFTYKGKTYEDSINSLTHRMVQSSHFNFKSEALNHLKSSLGHTITLPIDLQLLHNSDFLKILETVYTKTTNKEFVNARSQERIQLTFTYKGKTYEDSINALTLRMSKSRNFNSQLDAINSIKSSLGHTLKFSVEPELLNDKYFLKVLETAYTKKTKNNFAIAKVTDNSKITFTYNSKTYQSSISAINQRMFKSGAFSSRLEALDHLKSSLGYKITFPIDLKILKDLDFRKALAIAYTKQTKKEFGNAKAQEQTRINFIYKDKTYEDKINALTYRMRRSGSFGSQSEAINFLKSSLGHTVAYPINLQLLKNLEYLKLFVTAYAKQTDRDFAKATTTDTNRITFTYKSKTYEDSIAGLTLRMSRSVESTQLEALNSLKSSLGHLVNYTINIELLKKDTNYIKAFVHAYENQTGKKFESSTTDNEEILTFTYANKTYRSSILLLLQQIARYERFGLISNSTQAKDYLLLRLNGETHQNSVSIVLSGGLEEERVEKRFENLTKLGLEKDLIPLFGGNPAMMKVFLKILNKNMPEEEIDSLVQTSFRGLRDVTKVEKLREYLKYDQSFGVPELKYKIDTSTNDRFVSVEGVALGATHIYVSGTWNRRIKVDSEGKFKVNVPLRIGEKNEVKVLGINPSNKLRSKLLIYNVEQLGRKEDGVEVVEFLSLLKLDLQQAFRNDKLLMEMLVKTAEYSLIKRFGKSFDEGRKYVLEQIDAAKGPLTPVVLDIVLKEFEAINNMKIENLKVSKELYFYQKWCVKKIMSYMEEGKPGVILANDPGLGKTIVSIVGTNSSNAIIIAPNSVVSTWQEHADAFIKSHHTVSLQYMSGSEKKQSIQGAIISSNKRDSNSGVKIITNIEFLQKPEDEKRFELMNDFLTTDKSSVLVLDEAHWRLNQDTRQTEGVSKLRPKFTLMVTATPFKNPETFRKMLSTISANDKRFSDRKAFRQVFRGDTSSDLRALSRLKDEYVIRFRKQDVLEEYDKKLPLAMQDRKLPKKNYMPNITFEMSQSQALSIYQMFMNFDGWSKKYGHYMRTKENISDGVWRGGNILKRHALRQVVNNPSYIGSDQSNPKLAASIGAIQKSLSENRKIIVFCMYTAQIEAYRTALARYNPAIMSGEVSKEGELLDSNNVLRKFKRNEDGWVLDSNGYPIDDSTGMPMSKLDYERITFQNAKDRKVMLCIYKTGGLGVTLNAAKTVIFDDIPESYIQAYQAEDRAHRIDTNITRTHYDIKYYRLVSGYPKDFLEEMKKTYIQRNSSGYVVVNSPPKEKSLQSAYEAFFEQGTFDQVLNKNLDVQKSVYQLIIDGIADEELLEEGQQQFRGL